MSPPPEVQPPQPPQPAQNEGEKGPQPGKQASSSSENVVVGRGFFDVDPGIDRGLITRVQGNTRTGGSPFCSVLKKEKKTGCWVCVRGSAGVRGQHGQRRRGAEDNPGPWEVVGQHLVQRYVALGVCVCVLTAWGRVWGCTAGGCRARAHGVHGGADRERGRH